MIKDQLKEGTPNFAAISTNADTGLWNYPEGEGVSYYFRGSDTLLDNYVIFAQHHWRILRIDKDGNIKLIYNGPCPENSCAIGNYSSAVSNIAYNTNYNNQKYVGYTYDTNTDSPIKSVNETWYQNNLLSYDSYIADVPYCNDRSISDEYIAGVNHIITFGYYARLNKPMFDCPRDADKYTKSSEIGNGLLKQKIGLITADELNFSGLSFNVESSGYLNAKHYENPYWTMTPDRWSKSEYGSYAKIYGVKYGMLVDGYIYDLDLDISWMAGTLRPVITLNADVKIQSGNGSKTDPYVITTN